MKMRLNIPQALFTAFFVATIVTVLNSIINWDNRLYAGILAFISTIIGTALSKVIIKDED